VLEDHELIRVCIAGDEEQVEQADRAGFLELRELIRNASLEVCPGLSKVAAAP
jgi:hypothetical protein